MEYPPVTIGRRGIAHRADCRYGAYRDVAEFTPHEWIDGHPVSSFGALSVTLVWVRPCRFCHPERPESNAHA